MTHLSSSAAGTRRPLTADGSVELAVLVRSGLEESRHLGAGVVVGPDGAVLRSVGDVGASIYPRSCLKPLQALTVLRAGVDLQGPQAVLSTASHAGTPAHLEVVEALLARGDHHEHDLLCPVDWPGDRRSARSLDEPRRAAMNCSGKHAAFLLACDQQGWDTATYTAIDHPLQAAVRETVAEFTGEVVDHAGTDGCGAPVFATTVTGLARAVARVAGSAGDVRDDRDPDAAHLVRSVLADAWAIDGPGRDNTVTIDELGVFAKLGAEGVMVMGTTSGVGVAVKILDGNVRAGTLVALHLLVEQGVVEQAAADRVTSATLEKVLGGGVPVGSLRLSDELTGARA
ncbi:asparaginase [Frigoribacterium sp. PvP032]|uniref:asparaginase n=1 Tax=Frigoribacterium sp. PvP032 TaxID=2806589 RepID=UPI001AE71D74|nr:asparaginase [Frigoribacterium sp. PvP032]MBP1190548.1 L-asparaginase II [Frigoribacterium sp. PvP032]